MAGRFDMPADYEATNQQEGLTSFITTTNSTETTLESAGDNSPASVTINQHYRPIERAIEKMKLGCSHLCFIQGRPGTGKSYQIRRCLKAFDMPHIEISGDVSEAYLYRVLYEHNGKNIWFKDVVKLLKGLRSIELLKGACETQEKRLINKLNYSDAQKDLPDHFYFKGNLIFDFNSLAGLAFREDFEALVSRGDYIEIVLSFSEICEIMRAICENDRELEVTDFLISHFNYCGFNGLNLRTQRLSLKTVEYARQKGVDWRQEVKEELRNQRSNVQKVLYPILGDGPARTMDVKKYLIRSGIISTLRTAERRIHDWLELSDIYRVSGEERNFLVSLVPIPVSSIDGQ